MNPDSNMVITPRINTPENSQNNKPANPSKTILIIVAAVAAVIVIAALLVILLSKKPNDGGQGTPPASQPDPNLIEGYSPGAPLADSSDLDKDRTSEYSKILKLYAKLTPNMSYGDIIKTAKAEIPDCTINEWSGFVRITAENDDERIRFAVEEENGVKKASDVYFTNVLEEDFTLSITENNGQYVFKNYILEGAYSNKNRAINAYLHYLDKYKEDTARDVIKK